MSPDGAHFGHKCFYVWQEAPNQKLASQLISVQSSMYLNLPETVETLKRYTVRTVFNAPPYFKHRPICNTSNFGWLDIINTARLETPPF